jgi:hypothetical protein
MRSNLTFVCFGAAFCPESPPRKPTAGSPSQFQEPMITFVPKKELPKLTGPCECPTLALTTHNRTGQLTCLFSSLCAECAWSFGKVYYMSLENGPRRR